MFRDKGSTALTEEEISKELLEFRAASRGALCLICVQHPCTCQLRRIEDRISSLRKEQNKNEGRQEMNRDKKRTSKELEDNNNAQESKKQRLHQQPLAHPTTQNMEQNKTEPRPIPENVRPIPKFPSITNQEGNQVVLKANKGNKVTNEIINKLKSGNKTNHIEPVPELFKIKLKKVKIQELVPSTNVNKPDDYKPPEPNEGTKNHAPEPQGTRQKGTNMTGTRKPMNTVMNFVKKFNNMNENWKEPRPKSELKPDLKKGTNIEDGIGKEGTTDKKEPDKEPLKPDTKVRKTRTKEEPKPVRNQKPTPKRTKPKPLQPDGTSKLKDYLKLKLTARNENFQLRKPICI